MTEDLLRFGFRSTLANWYHQVVSLFRRCIQAASQSGLSTRISTNTRVDSERVSDHEDDFTSTKYTQLCRRQQSSSLFSPVPAQDSIVEALYRHRQYRIKVYGEGEWKVKKHGADKRRTWRKLHLAIDEATNDIHAVELTTNAVSDAEMVKPLLDDIEQSVAKVGADGAYDQLKVYQELETRQIQPLIPPRVNAVIWTDEAGNDLVRGITQIEAIGLTAWKRQCGYHRRSKARPPCFGGRRVLANG